MTTHQHLFRLVRTIEAGAVLESSVCVCGSVRKAAVPVKPVQMGLPVKKEGKS